ncbi:TrbC/VirB2 family protein [Vibrio tubiashii]|uniref:Conjugal transfer protein n=1 Tax=Vibrio tubiashii ATCC 19109 TaxID=1051646 RepID=F9T6N8_9VIBR|nr:TrbC/VirB2 family protein [Vibrio tubiashii]AIW17514.1 hypothetical protein IX91_26005 [Vibrio tubiashii ATCC 19109]EGU54443.1 hypothetical protein VITU9109_02677 [Vibrio tubiashii ATCC 19109]EIF01285.1 conjugal transfer prepropilin [Vibrio tubiashii NCIMB 1337 = ATCC 19106]
MKNRNVLGKDKSTSNVKNGLITLATLGVLVLSSDALAASGGLSKATDTVREIQTWLYTVTGIGCMANISYLGIMAKLGKKQWADVIVSIGQTALLGAAVALGTWAYGLFA